MTPAVAYKQNIDLLMAEISRVVRSETTRDQIRAAIESVTQQSHGKRPSTHAYEVRS